jgi:hypothetical protein
MAKELKAAGDDDGLGSVDLVFGQALDGDGHDGTLRRLRSQRDDGR